MTDLKTKKDGWLKKAKHIIIIIFFFNTLKTAVAAALLDTSMGVTSSLLTNGIMGAIRVPSRVQLLLCMTESTQLHTGTKKRHVIHSTHRYRTAAIPQKKKKQFLHKRQPF